MPETGRTFASPPIVDCHAHVFTNRLPLAQSAWAHPNYEYPVEAFLADLDRHGVAFGVISAATLYGDYNDYTLEALGAYKRLRATVIAAPTISAEELRRMTEAGVVGVRLALRRAAQTPDLRGYEHRKFLNRLADLGMHVELLARAAQMPALLPALDEAGVRVVVDHFGGPDAADGADGPGFGALLRALENGRTWVKLSAGYRIGQDLAQQSAARLLRSAGPERLVWGSDAPFVGREDEMDYAKALRSFEALAPDAQVRRSISDTGVRLYFF
jgi:predicted TIM-barrel fold metal-dependent hydrolase